MRKRVASRHRTLESDDLRASEHGVLRVCQFQSRTRSCRNRPYVNYSRRAPPRHYGRLGCEQLHDEVRRRVGRVRRITHHGQTHRRLWCATTRRRSIDPELNFPPGEDYAVRSANRYNAETSRTTSLMFRITDRRPTDAIIAAAAARRSGAPDRRSRRYRLATRLWDAWNVDLPVHGATFRFASPFTRASTTASSFCSTARA